MEAILDKCNKNWFLRSGSSGRRGNVLKEFMSRVFYSFYYLRWKAVGWKPHLLVIF